MRRLTLILVLSSLAPAAIVIDRIAIIAGKHVIKLSDIDRALRLTDFLNNAPLVEDAAQKRAAAERLIDQQLIRDEVAVSGYRRATDADAAAMFQQIRQSRFAGSDARMNQSLAQYGVTAAEVQDQLLWQLTALRFIDQRFRPGVLVTDQDVRTYYDQHAALQKVAFDKASPDIRKTLEGRQIDKEFDSWLSGERKRTRLEYRDEAFR